MQRYGAAETELREFSYVVYYVLLLWILVNFFLLLSRISSRNSYNDFTMYYSYGK